MSDKYKTLDVQRDVRWKSHFRANNLVHDDSVLWTGLMLNNPKIEPQASKLLCLLSPHMKRSFVLDHTQLVRALTNDAMKERVFSYGLRYTTAGQYVVDQIDWKRMPPRVPGDKNVSSRLMLEVHYTGGGGLSWIRQRIHLLQNVSDVPPIQLWNKQYGMCVYCDGLLYPPTGSGACIMSNYTIGRNRMSAEKTHAQCARRNFNCAMGLCVPSILHNGQTHNLVCHECCKINTKLGFSDLGVVLLDQGAEAKHAAVTGRSDLLRRAIALSNLTCVCSVYATGCTETATFGGDYEHYMRLSVYVTNITESVVVDVVLPFTNSQPVRELMASIRSHGVLLQNREFVPNTTQLPPVFSMEDALTGKMLDVSQCHPLVNLFAVVRALAAAMPAASTMQESYTTWLHTTYSRMTENPQCPHNYFDMVFGQKTVLMVQDLQCRDVPVYSTVSRLLTKLPVAFFTLNDGRNIYRLVAVYSVVQQCAAWVEGLSYDTLARPWTDGVESVWRFLPAAATGALPSTYSNMVADMEGAGATDAGHLFLCVFELVYGRHGDDAEHRPRSMQSRQETKLERIKHLGLCMKVGNVYEGGDLVRIWCILLKLVGSILFHRLSAQYDVKIAQNIFLFLYWTSCIIDSGFEEDDNEHICKKKILNIDLARWHENTVQVDPLVSLLKTYLEVVVGSKDIRPAFAAIAPSHYTNANTCSGVTRDLCVLEKARGLVEYTGYTPSRNYLLFHYLCCVLELDDLAKYVYRVRNVSRDPQSEADTQERVASLSDEPCDSSDHPTPLPEKAAADADDDDPPTAKSPPTKKSVARKGKKSCHNTRKLQFVVGEMVVVRVDGTAKQFRGAQTALDCTVIGPFEIRSFFTFKFEMKAHLVIPRAFNIPSSFAVDSLRKFVPHNLQSSAATHDTFIISEILAVRKTSAKLADPSQTVLVSWKDYALDEASWEPLRNIPIEFVDVFRARQDISP